MDSRHDRLYTSLIEAKDFSFSYETAGVPSLELTNLKIKKGEFVVICGSSGSGKSTLLKLINGLIPDYIKGQLKGKLRVGNLEAGVSPVEELALQVASVFQHPSSQFFHKLVKEELVFPAENQGRAVDIILKQVRQLTEDFSLTNVLDEELVNLSGGQQQRIALLTALMQDSPILVLDEPTANLDCAGIEKVKEQLQALKSVGKTILLAEHRLAYAKDLADRYLYLDQGRVMADWSKASFLGLTDKKRHQLGLRSLTLPDLSEAKTPCFSPKGLTVKDLRLKAGQKNLGSLQEITFARGTITAIVGQNGVGKSTLARYLVGLLEDTSARFLLDGKRLRAKERLKKTALVLQDVRLQLFTESVIKELTLGLKKSVDVDPICHQLGLKELKDRHPLTLSGGEQQRLVLASQLLADKEVFIFDEPTSGLDYQQMQAVGKVLQDVANKQKVVILISHDEELLDLVADTIFSLPKNY